MNNIFQNKFFQFLIFVTLMVFIAFLITAIGNNTKLDRNDTITIQGEGEVYAVPNIGAIDIAVVTEALKVEKAMSENTEKMNNVIGALKTDFNIDEKDIQTQNFNINPRYEWNDNERILVGYEINQVINVKIRNLDIIGDVIQKSTDLGANDINSLSFTFDDDEALKQEAREKAIQNAKDKAEALAKDLGVKMVKIVDFYESFSVPATRGVYYNEAMKMKISLDSATSADIEVGQNKITSTVSITYLIK
ncbi:MAG: SIMPL domain-containing protein [Bacilli bacterium]